MSAEVTEMDVARRVVGRIAHTCIGARVVRAADGAVEIAVAPIIGRAGYGMLSRLLEYLSDRGCYTEMRQPYFVDVQQPIIAEFRADGVKVTLVHRPGVTFETMKQDSGCKKKEEEHG